MNPTVFIRYRCGGQAVSADDAPAALVVAMITENDGQTETVVALNGETSEIHLMLWSLCAVLCAEGNRSMVENVLANLDAQPAARKVFP